MFFIICQSRTSTSQASVDAYMRDIDLYMSYSCGALTRAMVRLIVRLTRNDVAAEQRLIIRYRCAFADHSPVSSSAPINLEQYSQLLSFLVTTALPEQSAVVQKPKLQSLLAQEVPVQALTLIHALAVSSPDNVYDA